MKSSGAAALKVSGADGKSMALNAYATDDGKPRVQTSIVAYLDAGDFAIISFHLTSGQATWVSQKSERKA